MNREQKKKWQKVSVILAEAIMVLSVITIVVVMTFVAMGYNFGRSGEIEQSGLMQLHTLPTGATVELDGNILFARSNLSRTMSPGEHYLKITKDGYDTWEKQITMSPGRLMRLYYPRLFLQEREPETVLKLGNLAFYSADENRNFLLYGEPEKTSWTLVNIRGDEIITTPIDISGVFSGVVEGKMLSSIEKIQWSQDASRILVKARYDGGIEWVLVDLKDIKESVNLTKEFGLNFERMELASSSANSVLSIENGNVRKINVDDRSISRILIEKVANFDNHGGDIVYVTIPDENGKRQIGVYKDGAKNSVVVDTIESSDDILIGSSAYYDDDYLIFTVGNHLVVYSGDYPAYDAGTMKDGNNQVRLDAEDSTMNKIIESDIAIEPKSLTVSRGGEYILVRDGNKVVAVDLDTELITDYESDSSVTQWLDDSMLYGVNDGKLTVWDFDGLNKRELISEKVANKTVTISGNNKYIYYIDTDTNLIREKIQ